MIQEKMNTIKPVPMNLLDLQKVVANKITDYDNLRSRVATSAQAQQTVDFGVSTSKSSHNHTAEVNAIAQNSSRQESQYYSGTIRKRDRQRSES